MEKKEDNEVNIQKKSNKIKSMKMQVIDLIIDIGEHMELLMMLYNLQWLE